MQVEAAKSEHSQDEDHQGRCTENPLEQRPLGHDRFVFFFNSLSWSSVKESLTGARISPFLYSLTTSFTAAAACSRARWVWASSSFKVAAAFSAVAASRRPGPPAPEA